MPLRVCRYTSVVLLALTDPIIRMLDRRLEDAKKTDIYRRLASEEFKVSSAPATK